MRKTLLALFLLAGTWQATAQPRFHNQLLQQMAQATALALPDSLGAMTDDDSTWHYRGRTLRVRTNALGDVSHIGYKLFHNEIISLYGNPSLFDFLERYFLELDLRLDGKSRAERMGVDRVAVKNGSAAMMGRVKETDAVSVSYVPRRSYAVTWTLDGAPFTLSFPTDGQLMMGSNAIELENIVARDVPRMPLIVDWGEALAPWAHAREERTDSLRQKHYGTYLSRLIGSRIFLRQDDRQWVPDVRAANPVRSVSTLMLTGASEANIPIDLTIDRYGYRHQQLQATLQQLLAYFRAENSRVFVGIKSRTATEVRGTLFVLNEQMGFNHVLPFTFPLSLLDGDLSASVVMRMYAYIPLQNVTEKFFEYKDYQEPDYEN